MKKDKGEALSARRSKHQCLLALLVCIASLVVAGCPPPHRPPPSTTTTNTTSTTATTTTITTTTTTTTTTILILQAESYTQKIQSANGRIRIERQSNASNTLCVHMGPDPGTEMDGIGDTLIFDVSLGRDFSQGVFEIQYSDDVGGNVILVYLDDKKQGSFRTEGTGGWNTFAIDSQKINLGSLSQGSHSIKLVMTKGGSYGVLLDFFKITNVVGQGDIAKGAYGYIKGLVSNNTGLVRSAGYDRSFTTIYKNALAAFAFIHEGDLGLAEGIFDFFKSKYNKNSFDGFNKNWDTTTGNELEIDHWVGDNAFLLLALVYYKQVTGSFGNYNEMVDGLVKWLSTRAEDTTIIAEGVANMYAALKPFETSVAGMDAVLLKLKHGWDTRKNYQLVLDHIERGALVFSDISGFRYIDSFKRTETWKYNDEAIHALAAFSHENFSNIEVSTQLLLAWTIWRSDVLPIDLSYLETELSKLWLLGPNALEPVTRGLPYFVSYDPPHHGWPGGDDEPIIDPTCYMLFYYWNFNPMAPGQKGIR